MEDIIKLLCVKRGSSLIIRILTTGYLQRASVKFPRELKKEGRHYTTFKENIKLVFSKGKYYYVIKNIDHIKMIDGLDTDDIDMTKLIIYEDKSVKECYICLENFKDIVFFPCGHFNTCEECARLLQLCPVCRVKIEAKIDIDEIEQS